MKLSDKQIRIFVVVLYLFIIIEWGYLLLFTIGDESNNYLYSFIVIVALVSRQVFQFLASKNDHSTRFTKHHYLALALLSLIVLSSSVYIFYLALSDWPAIEVNPNDNIEAFDRFR